MIMQKRNGEKRENMLLALIFTGLFFFYLSVRYDFYYDLNDDMAIRDVLSGIHTGTPSGFCVQILYPLSLLLSFLYRVFPEAPVLGVFLCLCQYGSLALISCRMLGIMGRKPVKQRAQGKEMGGYRHDISLLGKIGCLAAIWLCMISLFLYQLVFIQYSVVSGVMMVAAIFEILTGASLDELKESYGEQRFSFLAHHILSLLLVMVSFCIRTEVCMMLSPFLGLAIWFHWSEAARRYSKRILTEYVMFLGVLLMVVLLLAGADSAAYRTGGWSEFKQLFDARTQLYDFIRIPDESIKENQEFYEQLGLKSEETALLQNYNFALDGRMDATVLEQITAYRQTQTGENIQPDQPLYQYGPLFTTRKMSEALYLYRQQWMTDGDATWYYSILIGYALILVAGGLVRKGGVYWKIFFLFAFRTVIWIYLLLGERTPERITMPLHMAELWMLFAILLDTIRHMKENDNRKMQKMAAGIQGIAIAAWIAVSLLFLSDSVAKTDREYTRRDTVNPQWQAMQEYCQTHQEQYFLVDVYSTVQYTEKMFQQVDNSFRNYDLCGGWLAKSPITLEKLSHAQITEQIHLDEELRTNPNLLFISDSERDITWLQDYYQAKGQQVEISDVDQVDNFTVYQIQ